MVVEKRGGPDPLDPPLDPPLGSLLFKRVANRSRLGLSHAMHSASNTEWRRVHSVCTILSILERRSANAFLSPGMCLARRVNCASRARISTSRVRRYRGTDTVPPCFRMYDTTEALSDISWTVRPVSCTRNARRAYNTASISRWLMCRVASLVDQLPLTWSVSKWAPQPNCDASVKRRAWASGMSSNIPALVHVLSNHQQRWWSNRSCFTGTRALSSFEAGAQWASKYSCRGLRCNLPSGIASVAELSSPRRDSQK